MTYFSVVLYLHETRSVALGEEQILTVFKNGELRKIFALKREEATGSWRKIYDEEFS
jgi:hypothetical protein